MKVWVDEWQLACCGAVFRVGELGLTGYVVELDAFGGPVAGKPERTADRWLKRRG